LVARILIIDDEPGLVMTLRDRLLRQGYQVFCASNGETGFEMARSQRVDLILLDIMLPGRNGLEICEQLREAGVGTPILLLTARRQTKNKVAGLKAGGDDYLIKPFKMSELEARIEALLRRAAIAANRKPPHAYRFGSITIDATSTEVRLDGQEVRISAKEFQLLLYFVEHPQIALSRETLLREVWGYNEVPDTRTVDVHVAHLRQKLEDRSSNPRFIVSVDGVGYKFVGSSA